MSTRSVVEVPLKQAPWQKLQLLLDECYPLPPRNVFEQVVAASHKRQRVWLARDENDYIGLIMLSPHSKGGHLENLSLAPIARGKGIGQQLVQTLLQDVHHERPSIVSLTTRIPAFFSPFGFQPCGQLADGSTAMMIVLPGPAVSES